MGRRFDPDRAHVARLGISVSITLNQNSLTLALYIAFSSEVGYGVSSRLFCDNLQ